MLDRLEVKVSITKLLLALVIVIVPLSIFGLYLTGRSDKALDGNVGAQFRTIAELHTSQVSDVIRNWEMVAKAMAADPAVIEAVLAADKAYGNADNPAANTDNEKIAGWNWRLGTQPWRRCWIRRPQRS